MILKRVVKGDEIKNLFESSNILTSTYNTTTKDLQVVFKNGGHYNYSGVKETDHARFELADSQGKILNSHIKKYVATKIGTIDTSDIINKINGVNMSNKKLLEKSIIGIMKSFTEYYEDNVAFPTDFQRTFDEINIELSKYKAI